jgi:hypothetical protein
MPPLWAAMELGTCQRRLISSHAPPLIVPSGCLERGSRDGEEEVKGRTCGRALLLLVATESGWRETRWGTPARSDRGRGRGGRESARVSHGRPAAVLLGDC